MADAYLVGAFSTAFGRFADRSFKDLTREAYLGVLADAGLASGADVACAWFGNCGMASWGQANIRGQVCLTPLVRDRLFPERVPVINVEGGCATGSMAFHSAWKDVSSGESDLVLALGVEKLFFPDDPARALPLFEGGVDRLDPEEWRAHYAAAGEACGKAFEPRPDRVMFLDTYAMQACHHMKRYGTTQRQLAASAAKNHHMGSLNPKAQYRFDLSIEQVLADREVCWPFTRAMCSPMSDGAAAVLLASSRYLAQAPAQTRERAVRVRASVLTGGKYRALEEPSLSQTAAKRAFERAGLSPADVDVAEIHDATSFSEIYQCEMLGFCEPGRGGPFVESGATALDGRVAVNLSGGLVSKGHPLGATGLSMIDELTQQLRREAGPRQRADARVALQENAGGAIGFDEAACSIVLLER